QARLDPVGVGAGYDGVAADHQQRTNAARLSERGQHLEGGAAGTGQLLRRDAPDRGHVLTGGGVADRAVARQLVGLLSVLAPTLTISLPGDAPVARAGLPGSAERE